MCRGSRQYKGPFKCYVMPWGEGEDGVGGKRGRGVFVTGYFSVMKVYGPTSLALRGDPISRKKRYVTFEWLLTAAE